MSNPLLEQLAPIATPLPPGLWPLAIGWWLLIAALILLIIAGINSWRRHYQFWALKRRALTQLADCGTTCEINALLKRVAMHYFDHQQIATLQGKPWSDLLGSVLKQEQQALANIIDNLYRRNNDQDCEPFKSLAAIWLKSLSAKIIKEVNHA